MSRRGPNEGNIYLRKDGRWEARLHLGYDENGKRRRKPYYGHTRREAAQKLERARQDLALGLAVGGDERQTVAQFLTRWLQESAKPAVRASTFETYAMYVRVHLVPSIGRVRLTRLQPSDVQRMLNTKLASGLAPRTVCHLRAILRHALNQAVRWGDIRRNPALLVDAPHVPRYEPTVLTPDQARAFLSAVSEDRLAALYTVALAVGVRQGEALALGWEDVDLDAGTLTVRRALRRVGGSLQFVEPKTRLSRRSVALPGFAVAALRNHRKRQLQERLWAGSKWRSSDLVFTTSIGTPLDGSSVTHRLQRLLAQAGLPRLRFHDLRHSAATLLLAQGVHPRIVMETLGHSQISLTLNTYSHVIPSLQRQAADRMEDILAT